MKRKITLFGVLFFLIALVSAIFASSYLKFSAESVGDKIILRWVTSNEDNLEKFGVERRPVASQDFTTISYINANGYASTYSYEDKNIYKTTGDVYVYRLAFYDKGNPNPFHSDIISVTHDLSSVKRTWGSIKAMFR